MITTTLNNVRVTTQANVYFNGLCVSHTLEQADGTRQSVGVVLPANLTFTTGSPEIMECVAGGCEYRLKGTDHWVAVTPGDSFRVPGDSAFDIRVTDAFHYICHYG